ncbi:ankyrin repeat domain-containing protein [Deinococcus sp. MIMF12]|uniref:Ankyrin repeat domain-containing protein n=1 Tax=Deinococcus rhizophilus TaxID=3049544 RepID=A0ABT7JGY3_9DEIO|nr:ankyrin repeat domain-containing protein [Deinococcus rhizophilus]MDL2344311.1 ankyrin repeat domain-containing protein [Deinococcus rhizophilus]
MKRALLGALLLLPVAEAGGAATPLPQGMGQTHVGQTNLNAALWGAAERGDAARVQDLLTRGASPDARRPDGRTALTAAALGNHIAVARLLITAGADPDPQDADRNNALLVSGETGSVALLREVLRAGPDLTRTNRFGGTALIPAADRGHAEYVQELLKTAIDVDHVNALGWTALLEAVILGNGGARHTRIVRLLLAAGADPNLADRDGVTPLAHAQRRGDRDMVRLLRAAGGR